MKWASWGTEQIGCATDEDFHEPEQPPIETAPTSHVQPASVQGNEKGAASTTAPQYPSSSKSGPKDWDKLGEAEDDDEANQDVNFFFKKLYAGATPEQQRAMMKSFTESNGTSLSTNWDDVKQGKVETIPPKGVEEKKW